MADSADDEIPKEVRLTGFLGLRSSKFHPPRFLCLCHPGPVAVDILRRFRPTSARPMARIPARFYVASAQARLTWSNQTAPERKETALSLTKMIAYER
jgi:hypothetical protein